jgi:hypothetical protein
MLIWLSKNTKTNPNNSKFLPKYKSECYKNKFHLFSWVAWSKAEQIAASVQQWHNEKFIADFPFKYYYENRKTSTFCWLFLVLTLFFVSFRIISSWFFYSSIFKSSFYEQSQIFLCHCCTEAAKWYLVRQSIIANKLKFVHGLFLKKF